MKTKILNKKIKILLTLNILSILSFILILESILKISLIINLDQWINHSVKLIWNPILNNIAIFITTIGNEIPIASISLILFLVLLYKKEYTKSWVLATGMILGVLAESLLKIGIHRLRPLGGLVNETTYSFPSGHATMATIFFLLLIYTFKDEIKSTIWRYTFIILSIITAALIGFSRVYISVHWFSDVLAGFTLGIFLVTTIVIILKVLTKKEYIF